MQATYGRRQNDDSLDASLFYRIGPKTSLTASYTEALETSQQRAISNLGNLIIDPDTGELVDEETGLPFDEDQIGSASVRESGGKAGRIPVVGGSLNKKKT